jgi:hypothetical protein
MTVLIGSEKAELFATAHEDKDVTGNESDGYPKTAHRDMDLHNNEVGRTIGEENSERSEDEMADITFNRSLGILMAALMASLQEILKLSDEQLTAFTADFEARLPEYLRNTLHP